MIIIIITKHYDTCHSSYSLGHYVKEKVYQLWICHGITGFLLCNFFLSNINLIHNLLKKFCCNTGLGKPISRSIVSPRNEDETTINERGRCRKKKLVDIWENFVKLHRMPARVDCLWNSIILILALIGKTTSVT